VTVSSISRDRNWLTNKEKRKYLKENNNNGKHRILQQKPVS
jgi:hypothetical protein